MKNTYENGDAAPLCIPSPSSPSLPPLSRRIFTVIHGWIDNSVEIPSDTLLADHSPFFASTAKTELEARHDIRSEPVYSRDGRTISGGILRLR